MHDIRAIRANPAAFDAALARRGMAPATPAILALDTERRAFQTRQQEALSRRNALAKEIGQKKRGGEDTTALEDEARELRNLIEATDELGPKLEFMLASLPNILDAEVPDGADESANVVLHQHGEPVRIEGAKEHYQLGEALGLMDFEAASRIAGARFVVLKGQLARMERALGQFMLDLHTGSHGYTECAVPLMVNDAAAYGTDKLPKFSEDLFKTTDGRWLIPTAEVPLTALNMGEIIPEPLEPLRYTALTPCFRSEAGSAGRDTRGMLRQHQFQKVEMVSICRPEDSEAEHERMTRCAERVLTELGLSWRRVFLCSGDTGFGAARTYDLEVWLPGQQAWREVSSCSNTRDFQGRRMNTRFKRGKETVFIHSLNGSGVAVGRALIAVMETWQQPDGSVIIPPVLRPYMGGLEKLG